MQDFPPTCQYLHALLQTERDRLHGQLTRLDHVGLLLLGPVYALIKNGTETLIHAPASLAAISTACGVVAVFLVLSSVFPNTSGQGEIWLPAHAGAVVRGACAAGLMWRAVVCLQDAVARKQARVRAALAAFVIGVLLAGLGAIPGEAQTDRSTPGEGSGAPSPGITP